MLGAILKTFGRQHEAVASSFDSLDGLRAEIAAKAAEIEAIRTAPQPVADAMAAFDEWMSSAATTAIDRLNIHHLTHASPVSPGLRLPVFVPAGSPVSESRGATETLLGLLVLTGRDRLREVIEGQLHDLVAGRETLAAAQRAERIEQAEADLLHLHLSEELLVREMQHAGLTVHRRRDAPAIALLADDSVLPT